MYIVTPQQMRNIDKTAMEAGISGISLMERAGKGLLEKALEILSGKPAPSVAVFCGKGNNGGDGFVLARLLIEKKINVECFLMASEDTIKGDALINLKRLKELDASIIVLEHDSVLPPPNRYDLVIDAIFGTGFAGTPKDTSAEMIRCINEFNGTVLSVDSPSGTNMDTGAVSGTCVKAEYSITMGLPKIGHFFYPGREFTGKLNVHDLGYPKEIIKKENINTELVDKSWAAGKLPKRKPDGHKGTFGKILIVAGSRGMSGAAILAAKSALRSGAGMVMIATPQCVQPVVAAGITEAVTLALPETTDGRLSFAARDTILKKARDWADTLIVGPGMGLEPETSELIIDIITSIEKPILVDADGINSFSGKADKLLSLPYPRIFTPHIGEFNRVWNLDTNISGIQQIDRVCHIASNELKNTLLLKGVPTLTASPDGACFINSSGNSGMATAGSGDVLSGIIGGLIAQGMETTYAGALGAYLHGVAGNLAAEELGEYSVVAGDLIRYIPKAINSIT